ncbi:alpha/beta-Hydrolases superfamily protein [Abeliophyllum distichum]|uniref:Alpha/beta-Hydrolases superfamily protein n=1 Tax=Abeliophyllum distichum TaxID=126358 RepID=A0ABD1SVB8_9LAMI
MEEVGKQENGIIKNEIQKKPRILCLHGFRTSGEILKKLISRWPETVLEKLDLVFLDAPFPAQGKSDVEGIYDPPFYEWFQADKDFKEYYNFEECLDYLEGYMLKHGPFDGVLGFSQGALLSAALPGMQREGVAAFTKVPVIKFLIIISGSKFGGSKFGLPRLATNAFSSPINCPSLHIIGELDFMKEESEALLNSFVDPVVINHPRGHTVPRLDGEDLEKMLGFIQKMQMA